MAKSVGRQDDVVYQSIHHDSVFNPSEIRRYIESNKIVFLGLPCLEKDPETMLTVYDRLTTTLKAVFDSLKKSKMSQYFPYLIVFCDMMHLIRRRDSEAFLTVIKKANKSNLGVVQIDQDFFIAQEALGDEKSLFRHRVIMKQCDLMSISSLGKFNSRDVLYLHPGEFFYHQYGHINTNFDLYIAPYSDPETHNQVLYLVMS